MSMRNSSTAFGGAGASLLHGRNAKRMERQALREADIQESRALLLELGLYEPGVQNCFHLINNFCLSEQIEIKMKGHKTTDAFQKFINLHYMKFASEAIRCIYIYGFVPWTPRKLPSGDIIPETIPHGMFTWGVMPRTDNDSKSARYSRSASHTRQFRDWHGEKDEIKQKRRALEGGEAHDMDAGRKLKDEKPHHAGMEHNQTGIDIETPMLGPKMTGNRWNHLPIPLTANDAQSLRYVIHMENMDVEPEDVFIFEVTKPNFKVTESSILYATISSPMSHILVDYKNLRDAQIRRAYADAWNTTARVFTSCQPPPQVSNEPTQSYLYYETGTAGSRLNNGRPFMESRHAELEKQVEQPSNHVPSLYNLPTHHRLEQLHPLTPCEDISLLIEKYRRDVSNVFGVPFEMVFGRVGTSQQSGSAQADLSGRMFTNTVYRICKTMEHLIQEVYCTIYETPMDSVEVNLNPMPRLDIRSIDDIKILWEMGAVTPDVMAQLSEVLLLNEKSSSTGKRRQTSHAPGEYMSNLKAINTAQKPPTTTKPSSSSKKKKSSK
jgi:hypothetical protein